MVHTKAPWRPEIFLKKFLLKNFICPYGHQKMENSNPIETHQALLQADHASFLTRKPVLILLCYISGHQNFPSQVMAQWHRGKNCQFFAVLTSKKSRKTCRGIFLTVPRIDKCKDRCRLFNFIYTGLGSSFSAHWYRWKPCGPKYVDFTDEGNRITRRKTLEAQERLTMRNTTHMSHQPRLVIHVIHFKQCSECSKFFLTSTNMQKYIYISTDFLK